MRYRHHPGVKIRVLSNGAEIAPRIIHQEPDRPPRLVFTGNMAYPPNEDAVYYFCRQILPLIHRKCPDVWLDVIGNHPSVRLRRFCGRSKQVAVLGFVPDLRAEVIRRTLYVSPLRIGTGIKLKILEAMACGMPIVASPMSIEGMPVTDGRHLLVARSAKEFADKVLEVLTKPALRQQLGMHAQQLIKDRYEWETIGQELDRIYQEAVR
ncbi:MAG: glycosyltransferase [Candidatus Omnitrophica bacterium]|nr:glycosyltransferase [Candidatus Omnitrophota bacterium]